MQSFDCMDQKWLVPLFEENPVPMAVITPDHHFARCNDAFCSLVGYSRHELLTRTWQSVTHPDDIAGVASGADALVNNQRREVYTVAKRYLSKAGTIVWVNLHVRSVWEGKKFIAFYVLALPLASNHLNATEDTAKPRTILGWVKDNPRDAAFVAASASIFLGRDNLIEFLRALLLK